MNTTKDTSGSAWQVAGEKAFERVASAIAALAQRLGTAGGDSFLGRVYQLTLDGHLHRDVQVALEHFYRAHAILARLDGDANPEVLAGYLALARDLERVLGEDHRQVA